MNKQKIIDFFHQSIGRSHPIWYLRGNQNIALEIAKDMARSPNVNSNDIGLFDLHTSLDQFREFISHYPMQYRVCICLIKPLTKLSSLLKVIEEPPEKTYMIIVGNNLPLTHINRIGFIYDIHNLDLVDTMQKTFANAPKIDLSDVDLYTDCEDTGVLSLIKCLIDFLNGGCKEHDAHEISVMTIEIGYNLLKNLIDVYDRMNIGQISPKDALSMSFALVNMSNFPGIIPHARKQ